MNYLRPGVLHRFGLRKHKTRNPYSNSMWRHRPHSCVQYLLQVFYARPSYR